MFGGSETITRIPKIRRFNMNPTVFNWRSTVVRSLLTACVLIVGAGCAVTSGQQEVFTPEHVARIKSVSSVRMSPDGHGIAYVLNVQRKPNDEDDGAAWAELHLVDLAGTSRPFVTGEVNVSNIDWTPDGSGISFIAKRGDDEHKALYVIPVDGGEARKVVEHDTNVGEYTWSPSGDRVAFLAKEKEDKERKKLKDKGFKAEVYEEDFRPVCMWIATPGDDSAAPSPLELPGFPSTPRWSPTGDRIAVALAPTPLIDDRYMKRKIHIINAESGEVLAKLENPGKLGDVRWSPDGTHLAIISGEDMNDPAAGRLLIAPADGGAFQDLLPGYVGHVAAIRWRDKDNVLFIGDEGCFTTFNRVRMDSGARVTIVSDDTPMILRALSLAGDGRSAAFVVETPRHPRAVYTMKHGDDEPRRLTNANPWLADVKFARQTVVKYRARDGMGIEGVLMQPLPGSGSKPYPLIMTVHGGPESHYSNAFLTRYSGGGQVAAARGFAVFYPNYRGSTGRGVGFSKLGQADYGGGEFNDLVDAIDHLVKVGVTGGSYGGFASAWCATKLTEHFAAAVMFVGISDQISKFGTTDIPNEMYLVHSRTWPWDNWEFFRERSPISYVQQARTPILIMHGKNDTRVHPSQSMELYRYLKTLGNVPVRLVFYPGEGHGNRKAAGRFDYSLRLIRWMEHYLKGDGGDPPPYELDYGFAEDEDEGEDE